MAHVSPSGLAWVTNLRQRTTEDEPPESNWIHAPHVDYLDNILVDFTAGVYADLGYKGLIIQEPPRHGKSELTSHYFPAWYLGAHPDHRVMLASYEADFAAEWGGKVRDTLNEHGNELYGIEVDKTRRSTNNWNIAKHGGGMVTAGMMGAFTGRGANVLVIDDPVKNAAEAQSPTIRKRHWDFYRSTARTRLEPDAFVILIMTRWHEDDLGGRILKHMVEEPEADRFVVVRLPAIAEAPNDDFPEPDPLGRSPGVALWPGRYPIEELNKTRATLGSYTFSAMYQQRPAPEEGGLFEKDWFEIVDFPPGKFKKVVRRWDFAATDPRKGEDPDYTVGVKMGLHEDGNVYILSVEHFRGSPDKVEKVFVRTAGRDGKSVRIRGEQEPGSSGKLAIHGFGKLVRGYAFKGERSTGSKFVRAEAYSAAAERYEVKLLKGAWNRKFIKEHTSFPNAAHDDMVDAAAGAYSDLYLKRGGKVVTW